MFKFIKILFCRNHVKDSARIGNFDVCYHNANNIGDMLGPIIVDYMVKQNSTKKKCRSKNLLTVGSIIGAFNCNAIVWGSGIMSSERVYYITKKRFLIKYDIRAVRGPLTRNILEKAGYNVPECYGDPAVLMPLIYTPNVEKKYKVSIIRHHSKKCADSKYHEISVNIEDYKMFINEICQSELVISSSLHGIIIAEAYGIPAIFWNDGMDKQYFKYADWYYSTNRKLFKSGRTIDECLKIGPNEIPDLTKMQADLLNSFPY